MGTQNKITESIRNLAQGRFVGANVEEFITTFTGLAGHTPIIDSILQISTDEGDELEIGFFTKEMIADVTLSNGRVHSYAYPLAKVQDLHILNLESKWVLTISGEKKFDYNVVKPGTSEILQRYETSLRRHLTTK